MKVRIICHARWEIPFEFFSRRRTILNLLSTISFSESVDELDDDLDIKDEDKEGNIFSFFHALILTSFVSF